MRNLTVRLSMLLGLLPGIAVAANPNVGAGTPGVAPSDAEAEAAFAAAQKAFQNTQINQQVSGTSPYKGVMPSVVVVTDPNHEIVPGTDDPKNLPLEKIRVVIDVENETLRSIFHKVIAQAARYTGPWQVKWRLKPENMGLLDERVNLTAEAPFGEFTGLLTERVKNMTGVQLFVTTFGESRIIMIADTYY